jgi:hypothetical protein
MLWALSFCSSLWIQSAKGGRGSVAGKGGRLNLCKDNIEVLCVNYTHRLAMDMVIVLAIFFASRPLGGEEALGQSGARAGHQIKRPGRAYEAYT